MLRQYSADLHIHSCLSPCASLELSPRRIIERVKSEGLEIIAITDHNTTRNVQVIMRLGDECGIKVIPGMEVQSREEIHLLALFPEWAMASAWNEEVRRRLPDIRNNPEMFGDQPVVDEEGNIIEFEERLLLNSVDLSLEEIQQRVIGRGGIVIFPHFDRGSFSLISQLGLIPEHMKREVLEMSHPSRFPGQAETSETPRIASSDAHCLAEIGSARTIFLLAEPTLGELCLAFHGQGGRRIVRRIEKILTAESAKKN